jgi:hypothetical protein
MVRFYGACDRVVLYMLMVAQLHSSTALPLTIKLLMEKSTTSPPLLLSPSSTHDLDHKPIPSVVHLPN